MIRSTKKEVKQAIREYLLDNMDFSGYGLNENEMTAMEKVRKCYDIFKEERGMKSPVLVKGKPLLTGCKGWQVP